MDSMLWLINEQNNLKEKMENNTSALPEIKTKMDCVEDDDADEEALVIDEDADEEQKEENMEKHDSEDHKKGLSFALDFWKDKEGKEKLPVPLIDYLCRRENCNVQDLQIYLHNVQKRREILEHMKQLKIFTTHLKPAGRNVRIKCHNFSCDNANHVPAFNGYLNVTVRQLYYAKHGIRLQHPYLPCVIEHGGKEHRSYFPFEVLSVYFN